MRRRKEQAHTEVSDVCRRQYFRYMRRERGVVPAVHGVSCGDEYRNIDEAIAHCVAAIHGALYAQGCSVCGLLKAGVQSKDRLTAWSVRAAAQRRSVRADAAPGFSQGANLATIVAAHLYALGDPADAKGASRAVVCCTKLC